MPNSQYPFVVTLDDEPISIEEINNFKTEANLKIRKIHYYQKQFNLCAFAGVFFGFLLLITCILGGLSRLVEPKDSFYQILSLALLLIIGICIISCFIFSRKMDRIEVHSPELLNLIDQDPTACQQLLEWTKKNKITEEYVKKISSKGRLPTVAEYRCMEKYEKDTDLNKPVEDLKTAFGIPGIVHET